MKPEQLKDLTEAWEAVFGSKPHVEHTGCDVEGHGEEVIIDHTIAVWPAMVETRPRPTIARPDPDPIEVMGWVVAVIVAAYNYPHAPDDVDYSDDAGHPSWMEVVGDVIARGAALRLEAHFDRLADRAFAASLGE